jgi:hypothetical protein
VRPPLRSRQRTPRNRHVFKTEVRIYRVARLELRNLRSHFLDNPGDVVTGNERQRYSEKLRVLFGATRVVHGVHARRDDANENLIFFWLGAAADLRILIPPGHRTRALQSLSSSVWLLQRERRAV